MATVKIAVVGLGAISQSVHLPLLVRRWDQVQVTALVDLSSRRVQLLAARYGITGGYTSLGDLLDAHQRGEVEIDGVLLATTGAHGTDVAACVRAGLAVLVEKPLALSMGEIETIEQTPGARVLVGYMKEHDPATRAAAEHLRGRRLRAVDVEVLHPSSAAQLSYARLLPPPSDIPPGELDRQQAATAQRVTDALGPSLSSTWRDLYTNVVLGSIVHDISLLRHLIGGITEVDTALRWGADAEGPGSVQVTGSAGEDARVHLAWHFLPEHPDYRETITFHHDHGSVQIQFGIPYLLNAPTVLTVTAPGPDGGQVRSEHQWNQQEAFENELVAFIALITDDAAPSSGPQQAKADLLTAWQVMDRLGQRHNFTLGGQARAHLDSGPEATARQVR